MKEYRCISCHRLLFYFNEDGECIDENETEVDEAIYKAGLIHMRCSKCKTINKIPAVLNLKDWKHSRASQKA